MTQIELIDSIKAQLVILEALVAALPNTKPGLEEINTRITALTGQLQAIVES